MLRMPNRWVYVWYEGGKMENVANTDTLTADEAKEFKDYWEKARGKRVVRVDLQDNRGNLLKSYTY